MNRSHAGFTLKPSSNLGESAPVLSGLDGSQTLSHQPQTAPTRRIPEGVVTGTIPLEAAKSFPTRIWTGTGLPPRIAYADLNSHQEKISLNVKLLPAGAKTARHPQIVFYVEGPYHVEDLSYLRSNPFEWTTWMEFHLDARQLKFLIEAVIKAEIELDKLKEASI